MRYCQIFEATVIFSERNCDRNEKPLIWKTDSQINERSEMSAIVFYTNFVL